MLSLLLHLTLITWGTDRFDISTQLAYAADTYSSRVDLDARLSAILAAGSNNMQGDAADAES